MRESLAFYVNRVAGNRLPGILRDLAEALEDEEDAEQLRRLGSSLRELGNIAMNKHREKKHDR